MISVLIDTDVLIDVALGRKDFVESASAILDMAEANQIKAFIAWHSISNFYYVVEADSETADTLQFIRELLSFVKVAPTTTKDALYALDLDFKDFEDAIQFFTALTYKNIDIIVTRNIKDFKKSALPVLTPETFLKTYEQTSGS